MQCKSLLLSQTYFNISIGEYSHVQRFCNTPKFEEINKFIPRSSSIRLQMTTCLQLPNEKTLYNIPLSAYDFKKGYFVHNLHSCIKLCPHSENHWINSFGVGFCDESALYHKVSFCSA